MSALLLLILGVFAVVWFIQLRYTMRNEEHNSTSTLDACVPAYRDTRCSCVSTIHSPFCEVSS